MKLTRLTVVCCLWHTAVVIMTQSTPHEEPCSLGFYYNGTSSDHSVNLTTSLCTPCASCDREGEGVLAPCSNTSDTVCETCLEGLQYSSNVGRYRQCLTCTKCSVQHRTEVSPCTVARDTVCGDDCIEYYFLYVGEGGGAAECRRCSPCPPDGRAVIHWYECEQAGLPEDQQCAPGYEQLSKPTAPSPSTEASHPMVTSDSRGGFIDQVDFGVVTSEKPATVVAITVSVLSLLFTAATLTAIITGVGCFFSNHKRCFRVRRKGRVKLERDKYTSTPRGSKDKKSPESSGQSDGQSLLSSASV